MILAILGSVFCVAVMLWAIIATMACRHYLRKLDRMHAEWTKWDDERGRE